MKSFTEVMKTFTEVIQSMKRGKKAYLAPNSSVPTRTMVLPSSTAIW